MKELRTRLMELGRRWEEVANNMLATGQRGDEPSRIRGETVHGCACELIKILEGK